MQKEYKDDRVGRKVGEVGGHEGGIFHRFMLGMQGCP